LVTAPVCLFKVTVAKATDPSRLICAPPVVHLRDLGLGKVLVVAKSEDRALAELEAAKNGPGLVYLRCRVHNPGLRPQGALKAEAPKIAPREIGHYRPQVRLGALCHRGCELQLQEGFLDYLLGHFE
jgi:hypothetical protein